MKINVNHNAVAHYVKRLEALRKSALPTVVRNTINNAAFDVKKKTMPASAKKEFTHRKKTFFQANSKVVPAKGGNIENMKATVGFIPKDKAVEELKQQEEGGMIGGRSFVTTPEARSGGSWQSNVTAKNRMHNLDNVISAHNVRIMKLSTDTGRMNRQRKKKQQFIRAAFMAKKLYPNNALVLGNFVDGVATLSRIISIRKTKGGELKIKRKALYTYRKGRKVKIEKTGFMKRASHESGLKLEHYFANNAQKVINSLK